MTLASPFGREGKARRLRRFRHCSMTGECFTKDNRVKYFATKRRDLTLRPRIPFSHFRPPSFSGAEPKSIILNVTLESAIPEQNEDELHAL
jgi:hypothetical protein